MRFSHHFLMSVSKKILVLSSLLALGAGMSASAAPRINGAGASFPAKIYQRWFADLARSGGPQVNYQSVGSGSGRKAFIDQTVNFAASDDPMKKKDMAKVGRGVVQIPMVGGTIAFGFNKPGCDLKLSQKQAVRVAMGKVKNWKELGCKPGTLVWVHRSDGSGTTKAFTNSMEAFSSLWTLGTGKSVKWPAGVGAKGNSGVAGVIQNRVGAIGYLNYGYVVGDKFQQAAIQNKAGNYVKANGETSAAGLAQIVLDDKLRGTDANPAGANAFPIVSLTWILAEPGHKTGAVKSALRYMLSEEAQGVSDSLGYVPLPESLRQKSLAAVNSL